MVDIEKLGEAITASITEASGGKAPDPAPEGEGNDDPNKDGAAAGEDAGDAAAAAGGDGGEADAAGDADTTGDDAGKDKGTPAGDGAGGEPDPADAGTDGAGKPVPKAGEGKDKKPAETTDPVTADAKKEGEEGFDALLDTPLPNALKPATKERIRGLVERVKTTETERNTAFSNFDRLYTAIEETGATPQQYAESLTVLRLLNSGDRKSMEHALNIKLAEVSELSKVLGIAVPGVNLLEGFQDLIDKVGAGTLTLQDANEIAASRHATQRATNRDAGAQKQSKETRERQAAIQAGIKGLDELGKKLANEAKNDPDFARRLGVVKAQLKPILKDIHPSKWVSTFENAYRALPKGAAPAVPPKKAAAPGGGAPKNTPVRGGAPAGGQAKAPSTIEEAVRAGLKEAAT